MHEITYRSIRGNVLWLEVPVHNVFRMQGFEGHDDAGTVIFRVRLLTVEIVALVDIVKLSTNVMSESSQLVRLCSPQHSYIYVYIFI